MIERPLEEALDEYYKKQVLRDAVFERLVKQEVKARRYFLYAACAAMTLLLLSVIFLPPTDIYLEVAEQHLAAKAPSKMASTYASLDGVFAGLPTFASQHARVQGLDLEGGRLCSIDGVPAVQLVLRDKNQERVTLYQARLNKKLARIKTGEQTRLSQQVSAWHEGGYLLVMAR